MTSAFNLTKEALANATMLAHPHTDAPTTITVDASGVGEGAVLEQLIHESWQPLAFFIRQLRPAEKKYSAFDRELLALHLEVRHFLYFLEGRNFTTFMDHKPLPLPKCWSARQQRHLTAISEYTKAHHRKEQHSSWCPLSNFYQCRTPTGTPPPEP